MPRTIASIIAILLLGGSLASSARAQGSDADFFYVLRAQGFVAVNATLLEKLPGRYGFNEDEPYGEEAWQDLAVLGPDRYALRVDGNIYENGSKLHKLPFVLSTAAPFWFRMHVDVGGVVYAIRTDGMLGSDGQVVANFVGNGFADVTTVPSSDPGTPPDVYVLRVDGAVFRSDNQTSPGFQLDGDNNGQPDGPEVDQQWIHLVTDPSTGDMLAMRADGIVMSLDPALFAPVVGAAPDPGDPVAPNGQLVAKLPSQPGPFGLPDYADLDLRSSVGPDPGAAAVGDWYVLAVNGKVFSSTLPALLPDGTWTPVIDLVGESAYLDLSVTSEDAWALRSNGRIYRVSDGTEVLLSKGNLPTRLAVTGNAPDLTKFHNRLPEAAVYVTRVVLNQAVTVPLLLADYDRATDQLGVELKALRWPDGEDFDGAFDPDALTVTFPGSPKRGGYRFMVTLDDGVSKAKRRYVYPIIVLPIEENPDRNIPPFPSPIRRVLSFVGQELRVPILTTDMDVGDTVTVEVRSLARPDIFDTDFGATLDELTNEIVWTPEFEHIGRQFAFLWINDDGDPARRRPLTVVYDVAAQLVFEPDEG